MNIPAENKPVPSLELFVQMTVTAWQTQNARISQLLKSIPFENWMAETAPGRNTGIYLLGHCIAVNDDLFRVLGFGERLHKELDEVFILQPDKSGFEMPSMETLAVYWDEVNAQLTGCISKMQPEEWFEKHALVTVDDFKKEPQRNKLNVLINRMSHQAYHLGQLIYLNDNDTIHS